MLLSNVWRMLLYIMAIGQYLQDFVRNKDQKAHHEWRGWKSFLKYVEMEDDVRIMWRYEDAERYMRGKFENMDDVVLTYMKALACLLFSRLSLVNANQYFTHKHMSEARNPHGKGFENNMKLCFINSTIFALSLLLDCPCSISRLQRHFIF